MCFFPYLPNMNHILQDLFIHVVSVQKIVLCLILQFGDILHFIFIVAFCSRKKQEVLPEMLYLFELSYLKYIYIEIPAISYRISLLLKICMQYIVLKLLDIGSPREKHRFNFLFLTQHLGHQSIYCQPHIKKIHTYILYSTPESHKASKSF